MNDFRQVICGFPGVGKTTAYETLKEKGVKVLDSDSSTFDKKHFPDNYLNHIEEKISEGYTHLVSTHDTVREGLEQRNIRHVVVYPHEGLKSEYLKRYERRGSPESFIVLMEEKWDDFVESCKQSKADLHIELGPGQFLSDILPELG